MYDCVLFQCTDLALAHYEEVVAMCFKYIELLKQRTCLDLNYADFSEPAEKFRMIWEELRAMDEAHFRFAEKDQPSSFTSSTASSMQRCYPPDWVLSAPHLLREVSWLFLCMLMISLTSISSSSVWNISVQIDFD